MKALSYYDDDVAALLAALREPRRLPQEADVQRRIDTGSVPLDLHASGRTSRVMRMPGHVSGLFAFHRELGDYTTSERILNFARWRYQKVVAASELVR